MKTVIEGIFGNGDISKIIKEIERVTMEKDYETLSYMFIRLEKFIKDERPEARYGDIAFSHIVEKDPSEMEEYQLDDEAMLAIMKELYETNKDVYYRFMPFILIEDMNEIGYTYDFKKDSTWQSVFSSYFSKLKNLQKSLNQFADDMLEERGEITNEEMREYCLDMIDGCKKQIKELTKA